MTRYRNTRYLKEIEDDETDEESVLQEAPDLPVTNAEEESWKKRYGDLRRKNQADTLALEKKLETMERQLSEMSKPEVTLPKTEAQVKAWMDEFPDVAGIIKTIIAMESGQTREQLNRLAEENKSRQKELELQRALQELLEYHPDFLEIRQTEEFINWSQEQPKWVQHALYDEDEVDVKGAVRAIDLFKNDTQKKTTSPAPVKDTRREDATAVRSPRSQEPAAHDKNVWSESRVESLPRRGPGSFEALEDEINKAIMSGKFVYDLSGGAR